MSAGGLLCSRRVCAEVAVGLALAILTQIVVAQMLWCQGTEAEQSFVDGKFISSSAATTERNCGRLTWVAGDFSNSNMYAFCPQERHATAGALILVFSV